MEAEAQKEKFSIIVLGSAGHGKTSLAYSLTQSKKFVPKAGFKSQSKEIIHDSSSKNIMGPKFTAYDTIGYEHEDFKSSRILRDILDYLKDHSKMEKYIDAAVLVISITERREQTSLR